LTTLFEGGGAAKIGRRSAQDPRRTTASGRRWATTC